MQIQVKLKGTSVTIHPLAPEITGGGDQTLQWQPHDNSDEFNFDSPAVTFDQANAPISGLSSSGDNASATDNASTQGDFTYHVHLIDSQGNKITYPSTTSGTSTMTSSLASSKMAMTDTDPTIKNRPV
jgi:hypothetical protein